MTIPEIFCQNAYLPYPHTNAFMDDHHVLMIQKDQLQSRIVSAEFDQTHTKDASVRSVVSLTAGGEADVHVIFDIARNAPRMALIYAQALYLLDPRESYAELPPPIYRPQADTKLYSIPSIHVDGTRVLMLEQAGSIYTIKELDVATGQVKILLTKDWNVGHAHYIPGDESWVAFCHEGPTEKIPDRVWVWHATHAPEGKCVFDQRSDDPAHFLNVGHERWGFHDATGLAVAYGCSPVGPRGLWQVFADGRLAKQIFKNDRCWHCDISRDGRFALADTTGTWNLAGHGWQGDDKNRSILLIDVISGKHRVLGSAGGDTHPYHPHPVFSPEGNVVFFNTKRGNDGAVMIVRLGDPAKLF